MSRIRDSLASSGSYVNNFREGIWCGLQSQIKPEIVHIAIREICFAIEHDADIGQFKFTIIPAIYSTLHE